MCLCASGEREVSVHTSLCKEPDPVSVGELNGGLRSLTCSRTGLVDTCRLSEGHACCQQMCRTSPWLLYQTGKILQGKANAQAVPAITEVSPALSPQTHGVEMSRVAYSETRGAIEWLFWRSALSSPPTSSQQPRTDHVPFYRSSLSSSSIIKLQVPRCWLRQEAEAGPRSPSAQPPAGNSLSLCARSLNCL